MFFFCSKAIFVITFIIYVVATMLYIFTARRLIAADETTLLQQPIYRMH